MLSKAKSPVETLLATSLGPRMKRRSKLRLYDVGGKLLLALAAVVAFAPPLAAKSWRIADFQDTITVEKDGSALVNERITLVFVGEWHGIHRTIPIEHPGPNGTNYELFLAVTSITDGSGGNLKYESSASGGFRDLKIYIPDAVDTTRTVEIAYRVGNGAGFFHDYDEFYWNVTGNDWPVPIDHVTATVHLPASASGSLRAQAFTGVYGSTQHDATDAVNGSDAQFETNNPLPAGRRGNPRRGSSARSGNISRSRSPSGAA